MEQIGINVPKAHVKRLVPGRRCCVSLPNETIVASSMAIENTKEAPRNVEVECCTANAVLEMKCFRLSFLGILSKCIDRRTER